MFSSRANVQQPVSLPIFGVLLSLLLGLMMISYLIAFALFVTTGLILPRLPLFSLRGFWSISLKWNYSPPGLIPAIAAHILSAHLLTNLRREQVQPD